MRQAFRRSGYHITADTAFAEVLKNCAGIKRKDGEGTWLSADMYNAYCNLFELGYAHSIEVWDGDELVGGLYGTCIGSAFFGESMFSKRSNTSKMALISLAHFFIEKNYRFIDCQIHNDHLESMGATLVSREDFLNELETAITESLIHVNWEKDFAEFINSESFTALYK
jgi:leucyl/phenylalanyl-tRNA--protein transferase